jgi:hypothetical protein
MGHFALGRLLRYFIQPLLRDTLYLGFKHDLCKILG